MVARMQIVLPIGSGGDLFGLFKIYQANIEAKRFRNKPGSHKRVSNTAVPNAGGGRQHQQ